VALDQLGESGLGVAFHKPAEKFVIGSHGGLSPQAAAE
jgi:hypothetical protein